MYAFYLGQSSEMTIFWRWLSVCNQNESPHCALNTSAPQSTTPCDCLTFHVSVSVSIYSFSLRVLRAGSAPHRTCMLLQRTCLTVKQTDSVPAASSEAFVCRSTFNSSSLALENMPNTLLFGAHSWPDFGHQNKGLDHISSYKYPKED